MLNYFVNYFLVAPTNVKVNSRLDFKFQFFLFQNVRYFPLIKHLSNFFNLKTYLKKFLLQNDNYEKF